MTSSEYDFRSDTVTQPDLPMRDAIARAEVGDDVYGEDPLATELENRVAGMLGKEAGLMVSSGTQSNLIALLTHLGRGEEFLSGGQYHVMHYEAGGAASLGGAVPCALPVQPDGSVLAEDVAASVKADDFHFPITRLLSLENTVNGRIQSAQHLNELCAVAHRHGLNTHLDGARLMNAVVASNHDVTQFTSGFDTVSLCLSKGLGAPVGSVLVGTESFIHKARRLRKMLGGGMRQAGIIAAACLYALDHNLDRLADDHRRAKYLAERLSSVDGVSVDMTSVQTNMVYMHTDEDKASPLVSHLKTSGLTISPSAGKFRLVIHKDITDDAVDRLANGIEAFFWA